MEVIKTLLNNEENNHILPFFWQHGETEEVLRDYMRAIHECNIGAVCVESRPHPDFCGPKWWEDMDVILDEARKRNMKVWILDDAHFPTGYANGAVENAPQELCRQSICVNRVDTEDEAKTVTLELGGMIPPPFTPNRMETYVLPRLPKPRQYDDDTVLYVSAFNHDTKESTDLTPFIKDGKLTWDKPIGKYTINAVGLSRNCGPHRNYINMMDSESCRLLIEAVYEKHWERYKDDFGKTIAGFFSDEPELGNGHLYAAENFLGTDQDLPFSRAMPSELEKRLGKDWSSLMYLLWENNADSSLTAKVRYAYMDAVTTLVEKNFSWQVGDWCRERGVMYIGHVIEDNGSHAKTAASLGHFFRGLAGQDMSGIDDIGGQVYPQGEDDTSPDIMERNRSAEFYHFMLGRLASSAAAIEPLKKGRAMCEIFGNYGWAEGVQLEKYLADHFMVRGVNYYVPHAFSPKEFPDPDCPPHFYAHGNNPQYRHFGELMKYMNRVCNIISGGKRIADVAMLYHAESEWAGRSMPCEKPARVLEENQITFDFIPSDVFADPERFNAVIGNPLRVNTQEYKAFIIPASQFVTAAVAKAAAELQKAGLPVIFIDEVPEGVCDTFNICSADGCSADERSSSLRGFDILSLDRLVETLRAKGIGEVKLSPDSIYIRVLHTIGDTESYYIVNEAAETYGGTVTLPSTGACFAYDAWFNRLEAVEAYPNGSGTDIHFTLEPRKSLIVVFGTPDTELCTPITESGAEIAVFGWTRSICESLEYPNFRESKTVSLPDKLEEEQPEFSGYVRYDTSFFAENTNGLYLTISDAAEGVEVFVNGQSAGIQIVPAYRYDISKPARPGKNELTIEVATTLERKCYPMLDGMRKHMVSAPSAKSGITGTVKIFQNIL
ncbi:MAG: hypothetical protein FWG36_06575 [Oscillospiraceae bacterium]|nr:hypothetical protein [Oscillospiraceae bacterium]